MPRYPAKTTKNSKQLKVKYITTLESKLLRGSEN